MRTASVGVCLFLLLAGAARATQYNVSEVRLLVRDGDARKLHAAGIHSTDEILQKGATAGGRAALARSTGLPRATILTLARRADLLRLDTVSPDWVLLLEAAGVKSVADLAAWPAAKLAKAVAAANGPRKKIANPPPPEARLHAWIDQAKTLPRRSCPEKNSRRRIARWPLSSASRGRAGSLPGPPR